MSNVLGILLIGALQFITSYALLYYWFSSQLSDLEKRLAVTELTTLQLTSKLEIEKSLNERLNGKLLQLEFSSHQLQSQLDIVNAENKELRALISHGGRVIRQAIGQGKSRGMNAFINSDSVKGFLAKIKKLGLDND